MVELSGVAHPEALHDGDRTAISGNCERDDLVETFLFEAECDRDARGLGRVTLAPIRVGEAPPISTHGVNSASNVCTKRPTYPTNGATSGTSTAHSPKPRSANCGTIRSRTRSSDCERVSGDGRCSITRGSAFSAANGSRSCCSHSRSSTRSPCKRGTARFISSQSASAADPATPIGPQANPQPSGSNAPARVCGKRAG